MNIKKILSEDTLSNIRTLAEDIIIFSQENKLLITCSFREPEQIGDSTPLNDVYHALSPKHRPFDVEGEPGAVEQLNKMVNEMVETMYKATYFVSFPLREYCGNVKPRFCRSSIPYLDKAFSTGEIDLEDVKEIYDILEIPVPQAFL